MDHSDPLPLPVDWAVRAANLPEHARNAIHTDAGAQVAVVESRVVGRRVVGSDERATLDVHVVVDGVVVAALEHEAIVSLG